MVGIVLVTHGGIAREMLATVGAIVGDIQGMRAVSSDNEDTDEVRSRIQAAIEQADAGDGVLLLTDMFGGTPANLALSFLNEKRIEVVTGVNLPMLLKLATSREKQPLPDLAASIREYGRKNITVASALLQEPKR